MSATAIAATAPAPARRAEEGFLLGGLRRFLRRPANRVGLAVLALGIVTALVPIALLPVDPTRVAPQDRFLAPVWSDGTVERPLGTDNLGRDLLSRLVYAGRFTLAVTLLSALLAALVGVTLGMIGGYWGRWADLIAVPANPLEDIRHLRRPRLVLRGAAVALNELEDG